MTQEIIVSLAKRMKKRGRAPVAVARRVRGRQVGPQRGRRVNGGELKFHDVDLDDAIVASTGTITPTINIIAQGVTESTRIGRKCVIKKIQWRYDIDLPLEQDKADIGQGDIVRVILYLDKQTNGAAAAVTDILETANYQAFRNLNNVSRFRILIDKTHSINRRVAAPDGTNTAGSPEVVVGTFTFFKTCNVPIEYSEVAGGGVLTDIRTNNLGVLLISREGTAGFESKFRLRFSDN